MNYTTSARNCQTWELKTHSPQVFIRQIKLSGWRDPWKANTKEACYTRVQICFPFTASEHSGENVCSVSPALISVIPTASSEGRKAILSIHGVDFLLPPCSSRSCRPSGRSEQANIVFQCAHLTPLLQPPSLCLRTQAREISFSFLFLFFLGVEALRGIVSVFLTRAPWSRCALFSLSLPPRLSLPALFFISACKVVWLWIEKSPHKQDRIHHNGCFVHIHFTVCLLSERGYHLLLTISLGKW